MIQELSLKFRGELNQIGVHDESRSPLQLQCSSLRLYFPKLEHLRHFWANVHFYALFCHQLEAVINGLSRQFSWWYGSLSTVACIATAWLFYVPGISENVPKTSSSVRGIQKTCRRCYTVYLGNQKTFRVEFFRLKDKGRRYSISSGMCHVFCFYVMS